MGGAAEAKGEQANDLQRAAGEATGREGKQAPDKYQQIGDASGELLYLPHLPLITSENTKALL